MEYDDESSRPYDEFSDRSDNSSEKARDDRVPLMPDGEDLTENGSLNLPSAIPESHVASTAKEPFLFEEESDRSESEESTQPNNQSAVSDAIVNETIKPMMPTRGETTVTRHQATVQAMSESESLSDKESTLVPQYGSTVDGALPESNSGDVVQKLDCLSERRDETTVTPKIQDSRDEATSTGASKTSTNHVQGKGSGEGKPGKMKSTATGPDDTLASSGALPVPQKSANKQKVHGKGPSDAKPAMSDETPGEKIMSNLPQWISLDLGGNSPTTGGASHTTQSIPGPTTSLDSPSQQDRPKSDPNISRPRQSKKPSAKNDKAHVRFQADPPQNPSTQPASKKPANKPDRVPKITIQPAPDSSSPPKLSTANMRTHDQQTEARTPRSPKKRSPLLGVDVEKLMQSCWEMASTAPTSKMTARTKHSYDILSLAIPPAELQHQITIACQDGKSDALRYLLSKDRGPGPIHKKHRVALLRAIQGASRRHTKCVRTLIGAGVSPNMPSKKTGKTPLHIALENDDFHGYTNLIFLLIDGGGADPNLADLNGEYPLTKLFSGSDSAAPLEQHQLSALAILLRSAAIDVNVTLPGSRNTPLHLAVRRQDHRAVAMLLHKKASVDAQNAAGTTPLQMTASQFRGDAEMSPNHAEVLDLLLRHGASVDKTSGALARAALHWAVASGTAHAVEVLLNYRASVTLSDAEGMDAMGLAVRNAGRLTAGGEERVCDHVDIMQRLDSAGSGKDGNEKWLVVTGGRCPVQSAIEGADAGLWQRLLSSGMDLEAPYMGGKVGEYARKYWGRGKG
ncbi:ankyrin repeat-containing domain protein [Cercophora scortea]|uniref:Ankyrin repeat-containing domain protein n=1 Tax=Cercophora scortea TaxID=314031 RepID=A0AAE0I6Q9_9PEZI|nr:ankyrin repeat-containing domain protein [Cercophora scortea]